MVTISKLKELESMQEKEIRKEERDRIMLLLQRADSDKYLITDFYEYNKVNSWFDLDGFLNELSYKIYDDTIN